MVADARVGQDYGLLDAAAGADADVPGYADVRPELFKFEILLSLSGKTDLPQVMKINLYRQHFSFILNEICWALSSKFGFTTCMKITILNFQKVKKYSFSIIYK